MGFVEHDRPKGFEATWRHFPSADGLEHCQRDVDPFELRSTLLDDARTSPWQKSLDALDPLLQKVFLVDHNESLSFQGGGDAQSHHRFSETARQRQNAGVGRGAQGFAAFLERS